MNTVLSNTIDKYCPKFNKNVTNGTAKGILETIPAFFDDIIKSSIKSLNPDIPFKYKGYRKMTPKEEFNSMLVSDNNKTKYDLAESYIYMAEYVFEFDGHEIRRPLYLPFAEDGNLIRISNTQYHIVPVLSDTVISPSHDKVFVRLLKDKLLFESQSRNFVVNGERVPGKIIYTEIVKVQNMNIKDYIGKPLTSVSLYVLGEHGFRGTMNRYFGTDKWIVTDGDVEKYRNDYNVYESTKMKPRSLKENTYIGHDLKICIHKDVPVTALLENFIYGIIYTLDILPNNCKDLVRVVNAVGPEHLISLNKNGKDPLSKELLFWRILLGRVIYKNSFTVDRIVVDMNDHFDNLQGYLDNQIKEKLNENGIVCEDFFDLLMKIVENYNIWLINSKEYNSDVRNRYIDILYYIMYDLIIGFNKVILAINKRASKKASLSVKEVVKIIINELSTRKIFSIAKSSNSSLCLLSVDSSLDIKYPKVTAILEDRFGLWMQYKAS